MGDPSHLEKMGRELKCPICLSLLNSAVSLTCNHVFCNSCIVMSMKAGSTCPVCKVPFHRREIRVAPHMDNLVNIYKSMEIASGLNIFVTQNTELTKLSGDANQAEGDKSCGREENDMTCQNRGENQRTSRRKGSRKNTEPNQEISVPVAAKPSFPTKKRIQVPQYPLSETPIRPEKLEIGSDENTKGHFENSSVILKKNPVLDENGEPVLSPFFWLKEREDAEDLTQHSVEDQNLDITPPNIPTFSDIKDSDDENLSKSSPAGGDCHKLNLADVFDSEMFEWTQRPCSPELLPSPFKMQVEDTDEIGVKECKSSGASLTANKDCSIVNGKCVKTKPGMSILNEVLPLASSSGAQNTHSQLQHNRSRKRGRNAKKASITKCAKRNAVQDSEVFDNKGSSLSLEKTSRKRKKADFNASAMESKPDEDMEETLNLSDEEIRAELPASFDMKQVSDEAIVTKKTGNLSRKVSKKCQRVCSSPFRKKKLDSSVINKNNEVHITKNRIDEEHVIDDKNISDVKMKPGKCIKEVKFNLTSESNQESWSKKNIKVSHNGVSEDELVNDHKEAHGNFPARASQSTQMSIGIPDGSEKLRMPCQANEVALRKCNSLAHKIQCAFCLSSEDSEASGEMLHYYKGRVVAADYDGGSKVIHSHKNCAEWAPNVYFEDDTAINLEAELARSRRIKCCCCGLKGASLGCYENSCRRSFHVPCAKLTPQCRWDTENFVMLCPLHVSSKLPTKNSESQERRKKCNRKQETPKQYNQVMDHDSCKRQSWNARAIPGKLILCCSALTVAEREIVTEFERISSITVLKNWDVNVTHVIASTDENGACRRTLKVLMGILEGKWILNIEWVKACMKAMKPVEEEQFEITADVHGIRDGPQCGRLRLLNKQPKIFEGLKFYFMGDFLPSYKGYLQDLLIAGGGTILQRKPISQMQKELVCSATPSTFIIYSLELPAKYDPNNKNIILNQRQSDAESLSSSTGAKAVSNLWVLNCIAACKLQSFAD